jgi:predicted AAA+ superfamily ATPase
MESAGSHPRRIEPAVREDLGEKMVLVSGPRQCGKTTLAERLLAEVGGAYFSWDVQAHRSALRAQRLPENERLWVFDELHKMRTWRNWLKGVYDLHAKRHSILVTGSARLDLYRRGGDSLQGRYFMHRLHPFTLSELLGGSFSADADEVFDQEPPAARGSAEALDGLIRFGGFPEPLLSASERRAARWRAAYGTLLVRDDVRDLEIVHDLDKLELLYERLPATVGSVLSVNALREDLEVAFGTARSWLGIFERVMALFRVPPFGAPRIKAVKKEQKLYLFDWPRVEGEAQRFENLVVFHLLRLVHYLQDVHGERAELSYFRDPVGHEVDAVVLRGQKPWLAVEVKLDDRPLDRGLRYLLERVRFRRAFQVSLHGTLDTRLGDIGGARVRLLPAKRFLSWLP